MIDIAPPSDVTLTASKVPVPLNILYPVIVTPGFPPMV